MRVSVFHSRYFVPFLLLFLIACSRPGTDLVFRGGRIYTLDPDQPWAEGFAVDGDTILAVGTNRDMDRHIGRETVVVELDGRLVLPGFHDGHVQFSKGATQLDWARLEEVRSLEDVLNIVKAYANAHPDRPWVLGSGWRAVNRHLVSRSDLDSVSDRPVFLESHDGTAAWVNSKALELARVEEFPGLLLGRDAVHRMRQAIPRPSQEKQLNVLRKGIAYAQRFGITSIETEGRSEELALFEELERRGELGLRVHYIATVHQESTDDDIDRIVEWRDRYRERWLKVEAARIELDESFASLAAKLDRHGLQIILVPEGDSSAGMALDVLEKLDATELRHRIEGVESVSDDVLSRLGSLGILVTVPPVGVPLDDERLDLFRWASFVRSGARLVFGSHWPHLDLDPMLGIHSVVTRQKLDGKPEGGWTPSERLSVEEAVRAYTLSGAYATSEESIRGSLEVGKLADFVVLTEDIFKILPRRIVEVEAAMTVVGGRVVYASASFLPEEMRRALRDLCQSNNLH